MKGCSYSTWKWTEHKYGGLNSGESTELLLKLSENAPESFVEASDCITVLEVGDTISSPLQI